MGYPAGGKNRALAERITGKYEGSGLLSVCVQTITIYNGSNKQYCISAGEEAHNGEVSAKGKEIQADEGHERVESSPADHT